MNKYVKTSYKTAQNMVRSNLIWNTNRNVINAIKKEQKRSKYQFFEFGKIPKNELNKELTKYDFSFPKELINIWLEYGGGELWETENILSSLIDELVGTEDDMKGLSEFKSLLKGE